MLNIVKKIIAVLGILLPGVAAGICFKLFCTPLKRAKVHKRESALFDTASIDALDFRGNRINIQRFGKSERIVLLIHGWESRGSRFFAIIEQLLHAGYSAVTFDMPGHGSSAGKTTTILECDEICRQLQGQFGEFEAVIAHSFGVPCAFYTLKNGLSAKRLVAIAGLADFSYLVDEFSRILELKPGMHRRLRVKVERLFSTKEDIWNEFSAWANPERLTIPILVVHDEQDAVVPISQACKIKEAYPDQVVLVETSGLGHRNILFHNQVVNEVTTFIARGSNQSHPEIGERDESSATALHATT